MVTKRYPKPGCHIQTHFFFILLSWLTILTLVNAYAVRPKVDSLRIALFKSDDLRNKVKIYLEIAKAMEETTPDSSVVFLKEARSLAQGLKSEKPLADVYAQFAFLNLKQNQLDQAFFNFNMAAKYYGISGDQELSTRMKSMLGSICLVQDNIVEALTYFMEVIDLSEKHHLYTILPHVLSNVGNIYLDCDDYNTALDYYSNSLILFRQIGDTVNTAYPLLNLGEACYYLGNLDMSCEYIRQSIDVARKSKDNVLEARGLMILGMISSKQNKYPEAIDFFNKSYEIQKKNAVVHPGPANIQFSELMANFGDTWYRMGDLRRSLIYNRKGFSIARSMKQVRQIMITTQQLSMIFERESRFDSALFYHKIYTAQADSLCFIRSYQYYNRCSFTPHDSCSAQRDREPCRRFNGVLYNMRHKWFAEYLYQWLVDDLFALRNSCTRCRFPCDVSGSGCMELAGCIRGSGLQMEHDGGL